MHVVTHSRKLLSQNITKPRKLLLTIYIHVHVHVGAIRYTLCTETIYNIQFDYCYDNTLLSLIIIIEPNIANVRYMYFDKCYYCGCDWFETLYTQSTLTTNQHTGESGLYTVYM